MTLEIVRPALLAESRLITQLVNAAYSPKPGAASGWTHEAGWVAGNRTSQRQIEETIMDENAVILLGLKQSAVLACVRLEFSGEVCHIGMLAVDPTQQSKGIGKQMLQQAERFAVEQFGASKLHLQILAGRRELLPFYLGMGYQLTGILEEFPHSVSAGKPKVADLKVELLEKYPS